MQQESLQSEVDQLCRWILGHGLCMEGGAWSTIPKLLRLHSHEALLVLNLLHVSGILVSDLNLN